MKSSTIDSETESASRFPREFKDSTGVSGRSPAVIDTTDFRRGDVRNTREALPTDNFEDFESRAIWDQGASTDPVQPAEQSQVLERFLGQVTMVDGGTAFVTLTTVEGEDLYGQYDAMTLREKGICDGDWFDCETVQVGDQVEVEIKKRQRMPLPDAFIERMDAELAKGLEGLE